MGTNINEGGFYTGGKNFRGSLLLSYQEKAPQSILSTKRAFQILPDL
jgi:hypothetical protein